KTPTRENLQTLGDAIRQEARNPGALAVAALDTLQRAGSEHAKIVIDSIRNLGEVTTLREAFGNRLYLFAIDCPTSDRWTRLEHQYRAGGMPQFTAEDTRDQDEEDD